jgi:Arc/MetJ family transcription regulator
VDVVPAYADLDGPLTHMHLTGILMHMRTTLILDDELIEQARELSGLKEKTAVVHAGLEALIARESARRLAALGGSEPDLRTVRRRRPSRRLPPR